jgi:hypothetical protein
MSVKAVFYRNFGSSGGAVDVEDNDFGRCTIAESKTATPRQLRMRAAKKLRAMADRLEAQATRGASPEGSVVTIPACRS